MITRIRKILWRVLGVRYYDFLKNQKNVYLRDLPGFKLGRGSYDNGAIVWRWADSSRLTIGKFCSIAHGVQFFLDGGFHDYRNITTFPLFSELYKDYPKDYKINGAMSKSDYFEKLTGKNSIHIENDVWIGSNAIIMPGVTIRSGAVILPGSVVTKDVDVYEIAGGAPAKAVQKRFDEDTIHQLLQLQWWNWSDELIKERLNDFYSSPEHFIDKYCTDAYSLSHK